MCQDSKILKKNNVGKDKLLQFIFPPFKQLSHLVTTPGMPEILIHHDHTTISVTTTAALIIAMTENWQTSVHETTPVSIPMVLYRFAPVQTFRLWIAGISPRITTWIPTKLWHSLMVVATTMVLHKKGSHLPSHLKRPRRPTKWNVPFQCWMGLATRQYQTTRHLPNLIQHLMLAKIGIFRWCCKMVLRMGHWL